MLYRVVELNENRKMNVSGGGGGGTSTTSTIPANCQYVLIDSANGYIQALATPATATTIVSNISSDGHVVRPRPSVAIAPKLISSDVDHDPAARLAAAAVSIHQILVHASGGHNLYLFFSSSQR